MKQLFLLLSLLIVSWLGAQEPIRVQPLTPLPYPTVFSDYLGRTGDPVLILTNTDVFNAYSLMIGLQASGDNGITVQTNASKQPLEPIKIEPGATLMLTADELLDLYANFTPDDIEYRGIEVRDVVQSQSIPEGIYTACVTAYDYDTGEPLSLPGCTPPINIRQLDPPIITYPAEGQTYDAEPNDVLRFSWTAVAGATVPISYVFELATVPPGVNPYDAIENPQLNWVKEETMAPFLFYDPTFPPLEADQTYALRITAYDEDGGVQIRNEGRSDVVTFRYREALIEPPTWIAPTAQFINALEDDAIDFKWTKPEYGLTEFDYELSVYRLPGQGMILEAENNPEEYLIINETLPSQFSYAWSTTRMDDYVPPGPYAARVQISAPSDPALGFRNDGYSEWLYFDVIEGAGTNDSPPLEVTQKPCGARFVARGPQSTRAKNIYGGQRIRMHDFLMEVKTVTNEGNSTFRGTAETLPTEQLPAMKLVFSNLKVNKFGEVISGQFEGDYRDGTSLPAAWRNAQGEMTLQGLTKTFMEEQQEISLGGADGYFPLRLKNGLLLTGLRINPQLSKARVAHLGYAYPSGGRLQWAVFGAAGLDLTNGGLRLCQGEGQLPLLEALTYRRGDAYSFTLFSGEDGTHLAYDCEGVVGYDLSGFVRTQSNFSLRSPENQPISFGGWLDDRVDNLLDFIVPVLTDGPQDGSATFRVGDFAHVSLPDHIFRPDSVLLDHSGMANPASITLPVGAYGNGGSDWRGLAMPSLTMTLPGAIIDQATEERMEISVRNFVIDRFGSSFTSGRLVSANDNEPLLNNPVDDNLLNPGLNLNQWEEEAFGFNPQGSDLGGINVPEAPQPVPDTDPGLRERTFLLSGWPARLSHYVVALESDDFSSGNMGGFLNAPFFGEGLPFTGELTASTSGMQLTAQLDAADRELLVPVWQATATLEDNAELTMSFLQNNYQGGRTTLKFNGHFAFVGEYEGAGTVSIPKVRFRDLVIGNNTINGYADFSVGSLEVVSTENVVNNYPISVRGVYDSYDSANRPFLRVNYDFELGGADTGIPASSFVQFTGTGNNIDGYELYGAAVGSANLPQMQVGGTEGINLQPGTVNWEQKPDGGYHFKGEFSGGLGLFGGPDVGVIGQFGKTGGGQNFFGLQLDVNLGAFAIPSGIPGFTVGGFGGGIYYNMDRVPMPANYTGLRLPLQDFVYVPLPDGETSYGLEVNALLQTIGNPQLMNGRFGFGIDFRNRELSTLRLVGQAHFMEENSIGLDFWQRSKEPHPASSITVDGEIVWDFQRGSLNGLMGFTIAMGPGDMINGDNRGKVAFSFVNEDDWYINIGTDNDPAVVNFTPTMRVMGKEYQIARTSFNAYFMAGSGINGRARVRGVKFGFGNNLEIKHTIHLAPFGNDSIRFRGYLGWGVGWYAGFGNSNCNAADHFFAAAKAKFYGGLRLEWYDDCDKWELGSCDDWTGIGANFDLQMIAYFYDPTGIGIKLDLPALDPFYLLLGQYCDMSHTFE